MKYRKSPHQVKKQNRVHQLLKEAATDNVSGSVPFSKEALATLEERFYGKIILKGDASYDDDRQEFDPVYQAFPLLIAYVACYTDVKLMLDFAKASKVQVALRSGGHSFGGYSVCDGIVIDVSGLNNIYVNTEDQTAFIESGCTFERIFPIIEQYGLHMVGGGCPTVAVAGYMQGGGFGITSRMFGMNCDNVISCTLMLADGSVVTAASDENKDLFWALRGGTGGNFGVLLNITYQLYPLGNICGLQIKWVIEEDPETAAQVLYTIQESYLTEDAYPNLGIETILTTDSDKIKKVFFCATWIGEQEDFLQALQPLLTIPGASATEIRTGSYSRINNYVLENTPNVPDDIEAYARSAYIDRALSVEDWKNILTFFLTAPNQYTMIDMEAYGGKINSATAGENAFIHRKAKMDFFCLSFFNKETKDQQACEEWMETYYELMNMYTNGHSYQNYPDRRQADFRWAYWGRYYDQLVLIKRKYDPENFFHYQQSIGPALLPNSPMKQKMLFVQQNDIVYESY
jgi:FAD/FMN-containing dehydrogenase